MTRPFVGVMRGRSEDRNSLRDQILEDAEHANDESEDNPYIDSETEPEPAEPDAKQPDEPRKRKRNHKIRIAYFAAMDDMFSDSYEKQKAAHELVTQVAKLFESRGQNVNFDSNFFEKAATSLATVQLIREMSWLFGIGPEGTERIVDHTIDRLFGSAQTAPKRK